MAKLGLVQAVQRVRDSVMKEASKNRRKAPRSSRARSKPVETGPRRRSERVKGNPAPNYAEEGPAGAFSAGAKNRRSAQRGPRSGLQENIEEEIYTEAHVAALGSCSRPWTLFMDGYDEAGNRIYDKVTGQTCHQCRQKTLGKRTQCSKCESLSGMFCGDCLYMRYGEHVDEVAENPDWICPPCRDLCNCSFHRSRRGWAPTGTLYRRSIAEGYASVAHYLVFNNLHPSAIEAALPLMPPALAEQLQGNLNKNTVPDNEEKVRSEDGVDTGGKSRGVSAKKGKHPPL